MGVYCVGLWFLHNYTATIAICLRLNKLNEVRNSACSPFIRLINQKARVGAHLRFVPRPGLEGEGRGVCMHSGFAHCMPSGILYRQY